MANNEDREVPELPTIVTDLTGFSERLDRIDPDTITVKELLNLIRNDLVPFVRDTAESTLMGFEDIQDIVDPIKLTGGEAQDIALILQATLQSNSNNPELKERIERALEALDVSGEDEDEDDEEDEGDAN